MIRLLWHVYRKGHSVTVRKGITRGLGDTSKGWLYYCDCGLDVAR